MNYKPIPFSLDRDSRISLTRQVETGFKRAILSGRYVAGEVLPPREELASMLGVSSIVTREAIRRLVSEGFIVARPRIGSVVRKPDAPLWKGRVMLVGANGDGGYYQSLLGQTLRAKILSAGYLTVDATVLWKSRGVCDPSSILPLLKETTDMVVVLSQTLPVLRLIDKEGVPFVTFETKWKKYPRCKAQFPTDTSVATREMAKVCREEGVKNVLEVYAWGGDKRATIELQRAGIAVRQWRIEKPPQGYDSIGDIQRAALRAFEARLAKEGASWLPDLLFFSDDDHVASGALTALLHHGVDIPGDVRVVTLSNRGLGPVFHRPLARLEYDPVAHGSVIADYLLAYLAGKAPKTVPKLHVAFFPGETLSRH